jgi:hypothetical protein
VQNGAETLTIDLGGARHVQAIEMSVGAYVSQYPRALSVETSTDGVTWTQGFTGGAALLTYDAAIRDPRKVPITVPVDRGNVRFVRVHQTAHANRMKWSIVELRVIE